MKKSIILAFGIGLLLASCSIGTNTEKNAEQVYDPFAVESIVEKNLPIKSVTYHSEEKTMSYATTDTFKLYEVNSSSVPYVDVSTFLSKCNNIHFMFNEMYDYECKAIDSSNLEVINTANGSTLTLDFVNRTATYHGFSDFLNAINQGSGHFYGSIFGSGTYDNTKITYDYYPGNDYIIDLKNYNINMFVNEDHYLLPFDTACNLFPTTRNASYYYVYTGDALYERVSSASEADLVFNEDMKKKGLSWLTQEYLEYNYNNLALCFDMYYGMDEREMRSEEGKTKTYIPEGAYALLEPYKERLLSTEPEDINDALIDLFKTELDDGGHSTYTSLDLLGSKLATAYSSDDYGKDYMTSCYAQIYIGASRQQSGTDAASIITPEKYPEAYAAGINPCGYYREEGDTAYIQFNSFDGIENAPDPSTITDDNYFLNTITLIYYANEKIQTNKDIKNVIVDLSANGGGAIITSEFVASWINQGNHAIIRNTKSKSMMDYIVEADVNFDGVFDEKDYLDKDKNVYVMISDATYSSGNKLVCNIKDNRTENTYFIGSRSGGGACEVKTAPVNYLGASFRISCSLGQFGRLGSTVDNFITVDSGVSADNQFKINNDDYASFADIDGIIAKIHQN